MKYLLMLALGLSVGACSLKRTADRMDKNTEELRDNSRDLKKTSNDLNNVTGHLYKDVTFESSSSEMEKNLRYLFGVEEPAIRATNQPSNEPSKLVYAGFTVQAMWFNYWRSDYGPEDPTMDDRLKHDAEILFTFAKTYTPHKFNVDMISPDDAWEGIASLGAKLDSTYVRYQTTTAGTQYENVNFYKVVMDALKVRKEINPQARFPKATKTILLYGKGVEYMIQLRHNYLPMMVLSFLTDFKDRYVAGKAWMAMGPKTFIDLNSDDINTSQLIEWTAWLRDAARTRQDLRAAGIEPLYNSMIARLMANIDFGQVKLLDQKAAGNLTGTEKLQVEFAAAYMSLVSDVMQGSGRDAYFPKLKP